MEEIVIISSNKYLSLLGDIVSLSTLSLDFANCSLTSGVTESVQIYCTRTVKSLPQASLYLQQSVLFA